MNPEQKIEQIKKKLKGILPVLAVYFASSWASVEVLSFLTQRYSWPDKVIDLSLIVVISVGLFIVIRHMFHQEQVNGRFQKKEMILYCILLLPVIFFFTKVVQSKELNKSLVTKNSFNSIAILPFKRIGNELQDNAFSDGLVEDMITQLAKIKELRVISKNSSGRYQNSNKTLSDIGQELDINILLEGTIRQQASKVRISAQLIDIATESTLWAEEYDRELSEIFNLQKEVAMQIANALKMELTPQEKGLLSKQSTDNVPAYKLYLRGRHYWDKRTRLGFDSAEVLYKRAIELDPNYALAYSGLADCYIFNKKGLTQLEAIPIAKDYANKALSLDSTLAEAMTTIAFIKVNFEYDWPGSLRLFEKVIRSNPNYAPAIQFYGGCLIFYGEKERGIEQMRKALELDPLSLASNWLYGRNLYFAREFDLSVIQLKKTLTIEPDNGLAKMALGYCLLKTKNYTEALTEFTELISDKNASESPQLARCYALAVSGDIARSKQELNAIPKVVASKFPFQLAQVDVALGDFDGALAQLEKGYEMRAFYISFLKADPAFDPIRKEVRFKNILKKIGLQ